MLRATLRSLAARKLRLMLTAIAIVLGVTFVTGSLVLTDTSTRLLDDQFAQATSGVDLVVREAAAFGAAMGVEVDRQPVADDVLRQIRDLDGVADAQGVVRGSALLVVDGEAVIPDGPSIGLSWAAPPYNPFDLADGRAPAGDGEIVVDQATAAEAGITIGERIDISMPDGLHAFRVVGTVGFGGADGIPNTTVAMLDSATAQRLFDTPGGWSEVHVVAGRGSLEELQERLTRELGGSLEVATTRDTAGASAAAAQEQLRFLEAMLLALAATALVVGGFMIANTFAIVVAQRTREFATLRALGASSRQLLTSVLAEAVMLGTVASVAGVAAGIGAAVGLRQLAGSFGVVIPSGPLTVAPRTVLTATAIGIGVTLIAALVPARRASRTSPIAAMRDPDTRQRPLKRARIWAGVSLSVASTAALVVAITQTSVRYTTLGGLLALLATVVLAPAFASRIAAVLGRFPGGGLVARLARTNVQRAARRTAATALSLTVGLAVVTYMTVVATSAKAATAAGVEEVIRAELIVQSARGEMLGGLSPAVHEQARAVPGVAIASRMRFGHWELDGATKALTALDPDTFAKVADLGMVAGDLADLRDGGVVISDSIATELGLAVGDLLPMRFSHGGDRELEVVGLFDGAHAWAVSTGYLISLDTFAEHFVEDVDATVFLKLDDGTDPDMVATDLEAALAEHPTASVHDQAGAVAARTRMLDGMLGLVTVLLLLAVLIALLGITNTLALSIVERTREVGLLRAVGMSRAQLRWMIRTEAVLTAVVGAVTGVTLGLIMAAAALPALGGTVELPLHIPTGQLSAYLAVATFGGLVAGVLPGRRAARMDLLRAIGTG